MSKCNNIITIHIEVLLEDFIDYKHSQGYSYEQDIYHLSSFKKFCFSVGCKGIPGKREFQLWMNKKPTEMPQSQHRRVASVRAFHHYLHQMDLETGYIWPKSRLVETPRCRPHFFNSDEIQRFFFACDTLPFRKENPGREVIIPTAFRMLYCCGLRPIEILRLKNNQLHLKEGYVDIIASKKHKDRRLYLSKELIDYLLCYQQKIDVLWHNRIYFLPKNLKEGFSRGYLRSNFKSIWNKIHTKSVPPSARLYDFRHNFALANLNRWVKEGKDAETMILYLMKSMGHASVESTYYYLHLTPDFFPIYTHMVENLSTVLPEVDHEA